MQAWLPIQSVFAVSVEKWKVLRLPAESAALASELWNTLLIAKTHQKIAKLLTRELVSTPGQIAVTASLFDGRWRSFPNGPFTLTLRVAARRAAVRCSVQGQLMNCALLCVFTFFVFPLSCKSFPPQLCFSSSGLSPQIFRTVYRFFWAYPFFTFYFFLFSTLCFGFVV